MRTIEQGIVRGRWRTQANKSRRFLERLEPLQGALERLCRRWLYEITRRRCAARRYHGRVQGLSSPRRRHQRQGVDVAAAYRDPEPCMMGAERVPDPPGDE